MNCRALLYVIVSATVLDTLRANGQVPDRTLIADSVRAVYSRELQLSTITRDRQQSQHHLDLARAAARSYEARWNNHFLLRDVRTFASRSPRARRDRVLADSLRQAGISALTRDGVSAALRLWRESLRRAKVAGDSAAIAPALVAIGAGFYRKGNFDSADLYVRQGRAIATTIGDSRTNANGLGILASIQKDTGNLAIALRLYRQASAMRQSIGDTRGQAADDNNIGLLARQRGDLATAARYFESSLRINQRDGRQPVIALNLANLAAVATDMQQFERADSLFRLALNIQQATGDDAERGFVLHDLGRLQMRRGDYTEAIETLSAALRIHERSNALSEALSVRSDLASVQSAVGHPELAIATLKEAERQAPHTTPTVRAEIATSRADLALSFGNYSDAEAGYTLAEHLYGLERNTSRRADALYGLATVSYQRGNYSRALDLLRQAQNAKAIAGDRRSTALIQLLAASIEETRGNYNEAFLILDRARETLRNQGNPADEAATLEMLGNLYLLKGKPRDADQSFRTGLRRLANTAAIDLRWRLHAGRATALRRLGELDSAVKEYNSAIGIVERSVARVGAGHKRFGLLTDKWSTYSELAMLEQSRGRPVEAFSISERLRAREMVDILAGGRVASVSQISGREQDLRRRASEIAGVDYRPVSYRRDLSGSTRPLPALRASLSELTSARARALVKLRETEPAYASIVMGETVTSAEISKRLGRDEALLEYMLGDSACAVFVVTQDTLLAINLSVSREQIAGLVDFTRRAIEMRDGGKSTQLWAPPLRRLYREIMEPVVKKGILSRKRRLIIVPHGELHYLSFAALMPSSGGEFLVDRFDLTYAPSATAWVQLSSRNRRSQIPGVLALAPHASELPGSRDELRAISGIYRGDATIRIGPEASENALRAGIAKAGTLHLATFGVLNARNPLFSFVDLARSGKHDGRLEVNMVYGLGLNGQLVILSACRSGVGSGINGDLPPGDDWVGFVQAFLQGGASSVVASLWPIDDRSTAALMQQFHKRLARGIPPTIAIAEAQRGMLRRPATHAPYYWAAFVVNGNGMAR